MCEARAILKALQVVEHGEAVHIHTDSKGTVQKIRAMLGKAYREKRGIRNKGIIQEMINLSEEKEVPVMIEWVKGHETMDEKQHNWISKLKQMGNEMADKVAKEATEGESLDEDIPMDQEWIITEKREGAFIDWKALPKIYSEQKKRERTEELQKPADPRISKYGQGKRSQCSKQGRTLLFDMAMKAEPELHFLALKYAINKIDTREFGARQEKQRGKTVEPEEFTCPLCELVTGAKHIQTKEHMWSGQCLATNSRKEDTKRKISTWQNIGK